MKKHHHIMHNILLYSVFIFYMLLLLAILFRTSHTYRSVNLVPFRSIISYLSGKDTVFRSFAFTNVIGNIVIFLPFGVYLALFNPDKRIFKNVLFVFLFSLSVEILQYTLKLGIGDIDDVILNCLGGALGIAAYKILLSIFKDTDKVRHLIEILAPTGGILSFLFLFLYNL